MGVALHYIKSLTEALFPRYCCVCGKRLYTNERHLCMACMVSLPFTHMKGKRHNIVDRMMWDDVVCTEHANSLLFYHKNTRFKQIYLQFKYCNNPDLAVHFGAAMATDLNGTGFFDDIDCIVPIPLSKERFKQRGYNQSERLAQGISSVTHIPVDTISVMRTVDNATQTHLSLDERKKNVEHIFSLTTTEQLHGKHVLIVDDIITTGSTIRACAHCIAQAGNVRISVMSLATSEFNARRSFPHEERP